MSFSQQHTFRNSTLCVSISQKPNQLPKHSKVRCKEEEEHIQMIYKTQNRDLPPSGPFSEILSQIRSARRWWARLTSPVQEPSVHWIKTSFLLWAISECRQSLTSEVRTFRRSDILAAITRYSHVYARVCSCAHDNWVYNFRAALYIHY